MSNRVTIRIENLKLTIPADEFPLKSDTIIGFKHPELKVMDDESSFVSVYPAYLAIEQKVFIWTITDKYFYSEYWVPELKRLCKQYNGTLIARETDESGTTEYIRIRDGVEKRVRVIEEEI